MKNTTKIKIQKVDENKKNNKVTGKFVCREFLKGGALSIGKIIEEKAPPWLKTRFWSQMIPL